MFGEKNVLVSEKKWIKSYRSASAFPSQYNGMSTRNSWGHIGKSKLSPRSDSAALTQLNATHEKGPIEQAKLIFCLAKHCEKPSARCVLFYDYSKCARCFFIFLWNLKAHGLVFYYVFSVFLLTLSYRFMTLFIWLYFFVSRSNVTDVWLTIYIYFLFYSTE